MTSNRTERIADIFDRAAVLPADQRSAFLKESCSGDHELRQEVESLLAADDGADGFLEAPPTDSVAEVMDERAKSDQQKLIGRTLGDYRITQVLGEGGMCDVYLAVQHSPRRTVALKVIKPGMASGSLLHRFEHESQILARLHHPGIAQVYESGSADTGFGTQPFIAMEFVKGMPLDEFARSRNLSLRERLKLMIEICDAVQHAHQKGVIHRDLKPANIMIADAAGTPHPKVLDFGIARLSRETGDRTQPVTRTNFGEMIGTLPYMSPEQVSGDPSAVDTRSDVYALGVVCYELLAGKLPYDVRDLVMHDAVRVIREMPPKPLGSIIRACRGDVETILTKALEKDPARRYQSAAALSADLRHFLNNEPVIARPVSAVYQIRMFARRHKALVGGMLTTMLALCIGLTATTILWIKADRAEESATQAERRAKSAAREARRQRDEANEQAAIAEAQRRAHEQVALEAEFSLYSLQYGQTHDRTIDALERLVDVYKRNGETEQAAGFERLLNALRFRKAQQDTRGE